MFHEIHVLLVYPITRDKSRDKSSQPSQQGISISIRNIREYRGGRGRITRGMRYFHIAVKTHAKHDMKRLGEGIKPELSVMSLSH